MKKFLCLILILLLSLSCAYASDSEEFLSVTDNAGVLDDAVERYVLTLNRDLYEKTGARIIFCLENSTGTLSVTEHADKLFDDMGVKHIGRDNCVFIFICPDEKDYTVTVGEGISAALTKEEAQENLFNYMEEDFNKADYNNAVIKTFNAFAKWYSQKYDIELDITDDMSAYKNIVKTENQEKTVRKILTVLISVFAVLAVIWIFAHIRRKRRMARLRKKRQERRRRYNLAKHGDRNVRL